LRLKLVNNPKETNLSINAIEPVMVIRVKTITT